MSRRCERQSGMGVEPELRSLANGVRVAFVPCEAESVAFGLFVESGSRHEAPADAGISHFIEHMLFKGTPTRRPIDISRAIEGRGGNFNACTGEESTVFYAHLPHEFLADAVDILSDMYLNALIDPGEFAREKSVVIDEIRMYADEPDQVAAENLQRALFPRNALGAPVAGTPGSLGPMTPAGMRRYIRAHYVPERTVAVVAGRFDPDVAYGLVDARLGRFRAPRSCKPVAFGAPVDFGVPVEPGNTVFRDVCQTQLAIGYRTFGLGDPRRYAATVLDAVLGRGMSSRLFQEIREKRGLSYDIGSRMQFFGDAGMFSVTAGTDPAKADQTLALVDREIGRVRDRRVPAAELERTKQFLVGNFRLSHEKVTSKMFYSGASVLSYGRLVPPAEQIEAIRAVTSEDVRAVAADMLDPRARSVCRVVPRASGEKTI